MRLLAAALALLGQQAQDDQRSKDEKYLHDKGWICLGAEAATQQVHWTNLERGLAEGGPVTFRRALWIQRTADGIASR